MTRKLFIRLTTVVLSFLALALVLGGCGGKEEVQKAEEPAEQKVYELKFSDFNPPGVGPTIFEEKAAKLIEERTNGRVKITNYFAGSLVNFPETFQGVSSGISDITLYLVGGTPGVHQLNEIFNLPFLGFKDVEHAEESYSALLQKFPELNEENAKHGVRWLTVWPMLPFAIHTVDKPVRTLEDVKGLRLTAEGYFAEALKNAGGVGVPMAPTDWYTSLQKKVVDGQFVHWQVPRAFKTDELLKKHTMFGTSGAGNSGLGYLVNLETWNSLPADLQKIIEETYQEVAVELLKYDIEEEKKAVQGALAAGHEVIELTPEEVQRWADSAGKPVIEKWVQDNEAKGLPAKKVYEAFKAMADSK